MRAVLPTLVAAARPSSSNWARACHRQQECTSIISMEEADEIIVNYHQVTKHALSRYARGPHGLDWANQPNPFRRYRGARLVLLDHVPPGDDDPLYPAVFQLNGIAPKPVTKRTISQLLYDSLALSAWKSAGASTWSLRVNPSSGNLHPTEGYAICGPMYGVCESPFVGHYAPKEHALEIRAELPLETWKELTSGFPPGSLFIAFSSIFWREAWKYGERAFRYCNHDVGHAMGAVAIAAATLGWKSMLIETWSTHELQLLLGLSEEKPVLSSSGTGAVKGRFPELEQEHADCIMVLFPNDSSVSPTLCPSEELIRHLSELSWNGKANSLSREHVRWDIIYRAAQAAKKPSSAGLASPEIYGKQLSPGDASVYKGTTVRQVVRRRRSAVSMDGQYGMQKEAFYQILVKTMGALPFSTMPWKPEVNMVLFVHRVVGISQGIYILVRNPLHEEALRRALRSEFKWQKPPTCPPELPLYILAVGDCRVIAERLSCHQDIAGDGCFSLGMVARFEDCMRENGAWMYPRLFWEAGVLGQLLYLEAHAMGISATGIGCYFDDAVHEVLGIRDKQFQSLYHFTVGVPVVDKRIMSLPAYPGPVSSRDDDA